MTENEEQKLMTRYGITRESRTVFRYANYTYDRLEDAVNFARIDSDRQDTIARSLAPNRAPGV